MAPERSGNAGIDMAAVPLADGWIERGTAEGTQTRKRSEYIVNSAVLINAIAV